MRVAGVLWGAAERLDDELGDNMWRQKRAEAKELLGRRAPDFEQGVEEGLELALDDVVALVERQG